MSEHHGLAPHTCGQCCTRIEGIRVAFGGRAVLEGISLHLHCGELTTLIGPNGAGKTTLLRALLGEVPHEGAIHFLPVFGPDEDRPPAIGYVPQTLDIDRAAPLSVLDLFAASISRFPVVLGSTSRVRAAAVASLERVEAGGLLGRRLGQLSGGELQRVLLALALTPLPNLLLLDEPVAGVDLAGRELFYETVSSLRRRLDLSILIVSHDLAGVARVSDRLVYLDRRILSAGPPAVVLADAQVRHALGLDCLP